MCSPAVGFPNWVDENWHLSVALICMRLVMSEFECLHVSESTVNSLSPQDQSVSVVPTCFLVGSSGDLFLKHYLIQSSQFPCTVVFETSILQIRKGRFREFRLLVWGTQLIRYRVGILIYLYLTWKYGPICCSQATFLQNKFNSLGENLTTQNDFGVCKIKTKRGNYFCVF